MIQVREEIPLKSCECCGNTIALKDWMRPTHYRRVRFCSRSCSNTAVPRLKPKPKVVRVKATPGRKKVIITPHRCWREGCPNFVPIKPGEKPSRYAFRRYCSPQCGGFSAGQKLRKPRQPTAAVDPVITFESVEDYLARGGKITKLPDGAAWYSLVLSRPHVGGFGRGAKAA